MFAVILACVDGSPRAPRVLAAGAEMARRFGADLHLFRAVAVPPEFPAAGAGGSRADDLERYLVGKASHELKELAATAPGARVLPPTVCNGQVWRAILESADQVAADLIVLGSHGYGGVDWLLGATAGKVANRSRRHVLIIHDAVPPEEGSSGPRTPYR
jgi:nucleotide-binding universal stress UspA family protein